MSQKIKNIFLNGPISGQFIAERITEHQGKLSIGGHDIFLGQVREDNIDGQLVAGIEYSAYEELALTKMAEMRERIITKHDLVCMHVYHSLGLVKAGEICLFVFTSARHRHAAMAACSELVEGIKAELPVWGKEWFKNDSFQWKVNT